MKKLFSVFVALCFVVLVSSSMYGQDASATWALTTDGSVAVSGNVTAQAQTFNGGGMLSATAYCTGYGAKVILQNSASWMTYDPSINAQYAVDATSGNNLTVTSLSLYLGFSGSNAGVVQVDYSFDSGTSFTTLVSTAMPAITSLGSQYSTSASFTASNTVADGKSFIVKVSPWLTTTGTGKAIMIKSVVVNGTTTPVTSVDNEAGTTLAPKKLTLENYPNPFNPSTNIQFTVKESGMTTVKVYNVLGKLVATLYNGQVQAGEYKTVSFGGNYASGIYYYTINSSTGSLTKKMLLLK